MKTTKGWGESKKFNNSIVPKSSVYQTSNSKYNIPLQHNNPQRQVEINTFNNKTSVPNNRSLETSEFTALLIVCSTNMENSNSQSHIYNKIKCKWNESILTQQLSHQNGTKIFEFTNSIKYLSNIPNTTDGKGIIYIYHDCTNSNLTVMYFVSRKFNLNDGNRFIPSQLNNLIQNKSSFFHNNINKLNYSEYMQLIPTINWVKNVIVKIDAQQSEFITFKDFQEKFSDLKQREKSESEPKSDSDIDKDKTESKSNQSMNENDNKKKEINTTTSQQSISQSSSNSNNSNTNNNHNSQKDEKKKDDRITVSKTIVKSNQQLAKKPTNTPITNTNDNKSTTKFLGGGISHSHLFSNNRNNNSNKYHRTKNQNTIMEAMGARYQQMVSPFNTNNIHTQPQPTTFSIIYFESKLY